MALSFADDAMHRFNVLLEDVRSQQTFMLEAMTSMREHFDQKLDEGLQRVETRLDILEAVVRQNSADIQKNSADIQKLDAGLQRVETRLDTLEVFVRQNSKDIETMKAGIEMMKTELHQLRVDFAAREERVKIDALEQRVTRLEQRLAG